VWKRLASVTDLAFLRAGVACAGDLD
jgi:hypothetical protein